MRLLRSICATLTLFLAVLQLSDSASSGLVIVVLSQSEGYHAAHANLLRDKIRNEATNLETDAPAVILTHELSINGSWTLFPLLPFLRKNHKEAKWFFFCLDNTEVRLARLVKLLLKFDENKELWIGHALYDRQPTIIHHFADHSKKFKFPNLASGFAMTNPLLVRSSERLDAEDGPNHDFSIDPSYEFANYLFDGGKGVRFQHVSEFCVVSSSDCATYPKFFHACRDPVSREKIFVAVKTCRTNHIERIPIIMQTWMKHSPYFGLFSNESDESLPNVYVVPHTDRGHCAKTRAILQESLLILEKNDMDWLLVVDDDTIISMARLMRLLTCYNPSNLIALGERYGFRVHQRHNLGSDYLTGGAGLVVSKSLVKKIVETKDCDCPLPTTPDDMYLFGYCLNLIGVKPINSQLFHQARPVDYATAYLASQEPVSFHKFWMIDPREVYDHWFAEIDNSLYSPRQHTEF